MSDSIRLTPKQAEFVKRWSGIDDTKGAVLEIARIMALENIPIGSIMIVIDKLMAREKK